MNIPIGIDIEYDFNGLTKINDLIYFDGPLLSHYVDASGNNMLFYWVDVDDKYNRWLFFRVENDLLNKYVDKKRTLFDLIRNRGDSFVYMVDIDDNILYHNTRLVLVKNIDSSYLPSEDSYFEFESSDNVDLYGISRNLNSGVLEFEFSGDSINYGYISFERLSTIIPAIEDIRKDLAVKYIKNYQSSNNSIKKKDSDFLELKLNTQFDFRYALAGSFRIVLAPKSTQLSIQGMKTFSDEFAEELINLFSAGLNRDSLKIISNKYKKSLLTKYGRLIDFLDQNRLGFHAVWQNSLSEQKYSSSIKSSETFGILENLSHYQFDDIEEIKCIGSFYSINVHTGGYAFESNENERSIGKFSSELKKLVKSVSFAKVYSVIIVRRTTEKLGGRENVKDELVSFVEVK
jgi:hypothetical protein